MNFLFTSEENDGKWPDEVILSTLAEANGHREVMLQAYHHLVMGPTTAGFFPFMKFVFLFILLGGRTKLEPCLSCEGNVESLV